MALNITDRKTNMAKIIVCISLGTASALLTLLDFRISAAILLIFLCVAFIIFVKIKFELAVLLDIFLLSFVFIEPAPCDIMFIFLIIFFLINNSGNRNKIYSQSFAVILLCLFILSNIITMFNAVDFGAAIRYFSATLYLSCFCGFIFLYSSPSNYISLLRAYVLSSLTASVLALIGYIGFFQSVLMIDEFRPKALFKDPNVFGPFLIPAVIILIDDIGKTKIIKTNPIIHKIILAIIVAGVAISFSRAAWISLIASFLIYILLNIKKFNVIKTCAYVCTFCIVTFFCWNYAISSNLKDFVFERAKLQTYDQDRFASQATGIELSTGNPFGYGPGQHETVVAKIIGESISSHSLYIRVFVENGILGFILFISLLGIIILNLFVCHFSKKNAAIFPSSILLSILIGIMVNSIVIDTLHWRHFWFFIGMGFSVPAYSSNIRGNSSPPVISEVHKWIYK